MIIGNRYRFIVLNGDKTSGVGAMGRMGVAA